MPICNVCESEVQEVCPDGVCQGCHKSVSWEDCNSGVDFARRLAMTGRTRQEIATLCPGVNLDDLTILSYARIPE